MGTLILVAGENGSGKSRCAENIVAQTTGRRYYIATMQPCSEENLRRVEKHRRQRKDLRFTTLELPHRVGAAAVENGSVVLIGSIAGCGGWKTGGALAAYPLAKSAIHEYARCLAAHTRHSGVRVNCVIPGNINTPRTRAVYGGDRAVPLPGLSPLEHVGKPEDIASLVHFLCSEGGRYISGQCIRVDGGEQLSPC